MRVCYAFDGRRFQHAIDNQVAAAIVEMGLVSDAGDREVLFGHPELAAEHIARAVLRFLAETAA
jgi:hypothetical protein